MNQIPKRLAVINAFVDVLRQTPGVKGAEHDVPFEYEGRKFPFVFVYDSDEEYNFEGATDQSDTTLMVETSTVFEWSEQRNKTPRAIGSTLLAHQLRQVALNFRLGGIALDVTPSESSVGEVVTDDGTKLAAAVCRWRIRYSYPQTNPFVEV